MPNQIHLTPTATVIMLPQEATRCFIQQLVSEWLHVFVDDILVDTILLPDGTWELHPNAFDVSDDVAKGIVKRINDYFTRNHASRYRNYMDYEDKEDVTYFDTALLSYHSLLKLKGVYAVNPYIRHGLIASSAKKNNDKWQAAQLTTGRYCLIIKKN